MSSNHHRHLPPVNNQPGIPQSLKVPLPSQALEAVQLSLTGHVVAGTQNSSHSAYALHMTHAPKPSFLACMPKLKNPPFPALDSHTFHTSWATSAVADKHILAMALLERVEKLKVIKTKLDRDLVEASKVVSSVQDQIGNVNKEVSVLVKALEGYGIKAGDVSLDEVLNSAHGGAQKRNPQAHRDLSLSASDRLRALVAENEAGSNLRVNKQVVIEQAKQILQVMDSMHVRDLHGVLSEKMIEKKLGEVPNWQRLSQILSGAEEFESDRTRGWSLKK